MVAQNATMTTTTTTTMSKRKKEYNDHNNNKLTQRYLDIFFFFNSQNGIHQNRGKETTYKISKHKVKQCKAKPKNESKRKMHVGEMEAARGGCSGSSHNSMIASMIHFQSFWLTARDCMPLNIRFISVSVSDHRFGIEFFMYTHTFVRTIRIVQSSWSMVLCAMWNSKMLAEHLSNQRFFAYSCFVRNSFIKVIYSCIQFEYFADTAIHAQARTHAAHTHITPEYAIFIKVNVRGITSDKSDIHKFCAYFG